MTGSGNDFVFFDARTDPSDLLERPEVIQAICHRSNGIGADGIVLLKAGVSGTAVSMRYYNSDGSLASLCGNATLCTTRLATELGAAPGDGFAIATDAGVVNARVRNGDPEIDLQPIQGLEPAFKTGLETTERQIGFAEAGVPHLVVLVEDADSVPLDARGSKLRRHPSLEAGANVNFVSGQQGHWRMRTFERGVEGETLACGTGAVASAALLRVWGLDGDEIRLETSSGRDLVVRLKEDAGNLVPSLAGEGRIVFSGVIGDLAGALQHSKS